MDLSKHFDQLLAKHWDFLDKGWPSMIPSKKHRTSPNDVGFITEVKETLYKRLGAIPVYFFLIMIWPKSQYPGPYRAVEKGLAILYHIVKGLSMAEMDPIIAKSSFHLIHSQFYDKEYAVHNKYITNCLATMFSNIIIRLLSAREKNPTLFKHVTLHLDGHDTRATYKGESSAEMYSYKLKRSGLRTQVVMDCNGMALWVSKSASCQKNADGTMLLDMKLDRNVHELDCIAVDGGYTQYLNKVVEVSDKFSKQNFVHPVRKRRNKDLTEEESAYNSTFGSFRSQMESLFGDLGNIFEKHNNRKPVLVAKKETYNLQMKLAFLLLNIKKMVALLKIPTEPIHIAWLHDGFEYPTTEKGLEQPMEYVDISTVVDEGHTMATLQDKFLSLAVDDVDTTMGAPQRKQSNIVIEIPPKKKRQRNVAEEHDDNL
jgi:DDE superfamily endonuclease